jgi:hypothetical protein
MDQSTSHVGNKSTKGSDGSASDRSESLTAGGKTEGFGQGDASNVTPGKMTGSPGGGSDETR